MRYTAQFSADGSLQGVPFAGPESITLTGYGNTLNSNNPVFAGTRYVDLDSFYSSIGDTTLPIEGPASASGSDAGFVGLGGGGGGIVFYGGPGDDRGDLFADLTLATVTAYVTTFQTGGGSLTLDVPDGTPVLFTTTLTPTPEPSAVLLLGTGVAGGVGVLRGRGKRSRGR